MPTRPENLPASSATDTRTRPTAWEEYEGSKGYVDPWAHKPPKPPKPSPQSLCEDAYALALLQAAADPLGALQAGMAYDVCLQTASASGTGPYAPVGTVGTGANTAQAYVASGGAVGGGAAARAPSAPAVQATDAVAVVSSLLSEPIVLGGLGALALVLLWGRK